MADTIATSGALKLNPHARFTYRRVGREGHPLVIIDDVLEDPEVLIRRARSAEFTRPKTFYPGLNAPLPEEYSRLVVDALRPILQRTFGIPAHLPLSFFGFFGLTIDQVEDLKPIQKVPHHDSMNPFHIASVHFLCRQAAGGTAFFRHTATGFESVDDRRLDTFVGQASKELDAEAGRLTHYVDSRTHGFELIETVELVFNRMILYRSHVLHSGLLAEAHLSTDPATGRLTANTFVEVAMSATGSSLP